MLLFFITQEHFSDLCSIFFNFFVIDFLWDTIFPVFTYNGAKETEKQGEGMKGS